MIKELIEIRNELLVAAESGDILYIKMQINRIDTILYNQSKTGDRKLTLIPEWQMRSIEDTLRVTNNIHGSASKVTCHDRMVCKAWEYAKDSLEKGQSKYFDQVLANSSEKSKEKVKKAFDKLEKGVKIEKIKVCTSCLSVGVTHTDCMCTYTDYETIELEFEVCTCCGNLVEDGSPAETDFNDEQFKKLK